MAGPDPALSDIDRTLERIHRTLEFVAFLLAVLVLQNGGTLGIVVGGGAALLLAYDALTNVLESDR
ncbi:MULTISPECIES: hypothetical protein [Halorussus]|uniref:hypothetical protein n=1 Tax=Halorussus TaxID=1070314 RepID=UPI000E218A9F|nr:MULTISPECIES: hypothetical protein [Halorussus]NHN59058.1 hypothetical protein [Halorussus sp. JP-T4]